MPSDRGQLKRRGGDALASDMEPSILDFCSLAIVFFGVASYSCGTMHI